MNMQRWWAEVALQTVRGLFFITSGADLCRDGGRQESELEGKEDVRLHAAEEPHALHFFWFWEKKNR